MREGRAVAVRSRHGRSELVVVDLASGRVDPLAQSAASDAGAAPGRLWSHPRVSPDGARVAALRHRDGSWRLVLVNPAELAGREPPVELAAGAGVFGPPAWAPDGRRLFAATDATGTWELAAFATSGAEGSEMTTLTRVTGGAFSPAPAPDGKSLFCLELTARGIDIARLALEKTPPAASAERLPPLLAPPAGSAPPLALGPVPASQPYRAMSTHVLRLFSGFTLGPDGQSFQAGVEGNDVVGRLDWIAAAAFGDAAGPRGGTVAAAWLGWPVAVRAQIFSALERPGSQRLVSRPELDQERRGGTITLSGNAERPWGRMLAEGFGGAARIEALETGERFDRSLAGGRARVEWRRFRGRSGVALAGEAGGEVGRTDGSSWSLGWAEARASGALSGVRLSLAGRAGRAGGSPTDFDRFAIGGAPSAILPPAFDHQRVESPALPAAVELGDRFEGFRAELSGVSGPLVLYAERWRAWDAGTEKPSPIRLEGIEARLERLIPLDLPESLSLYAGVARVRNESPRFDSIRGYAGLIYRP
jgi:hypothetical protein